VHRKQSILVGLIILAIATGSITFVAAQFPSTPTNPTQQTRSVDIEVLTVPRSNGIFLSIQPANFTAAFSFAPANPVVQINKVLLSLSWDHLSLGHVGDQFSIQLNGHSPSLMTMNYFATQLVTLPNNTVQAGANTIDIGVIPIDPFATQTNTYYLLFEVRLTVQYTFLSA
jgi:hypothetical protein